MVKAPDARCGLARYIGDMPPRVRNLSQTDRDAWASYVRHVRALAGRAAPASAPAPAAPPSAMTPALAKQVAAAVPAPAPASRPADSVARPRTVPVPAVVTGLQPAGLDNATWGKFRGGKMVPVRTLDLHGKTAQVAFHALERFLLQAHAEQVRCVEVITGRGSGEAGGVIKRELPMWLNLPRLRPLVLATAHPHARNSGSTRVLIRRIK